MKKNKNNLNLSQSAHSRLFRKNDKLFGKTGKEIYLYKSAYHRQVIADQNSAGFVFDRNLRKQVYSSVKNELDIWFGKK